MTQAGHEQYRQLKPNGRQAGDTKWADLEALILERLADGRATTRDLKQLGKTHGYTDDQVAKALSTRWMDLPRRPGREHFDPWSVYHPFDPLAAQLGVSHAIDTWLVDWFRTHQGTPVRSTIVASAAKAAGFESKALETAYRRLGITAKKDGSHWFRQLTVDKIVALDAVRNRGA